MYIKHMDGNTLIYYQEVISGYLGLWLFIFFKLLIISKCPRMSMQNLEF